MKTILVLTDFTVRANHAAYYALRLAQKIEANILLCNVFYVAAREETQHVTWPADEFRVTEMNSKYDLRTLAIRMNKQLDNNMEFGTFRPQIRYCAKAGHVAEVMNDIVYHNEIVLTVVGMHNSVGLNTFLLGNHTREIIEKADCPVLVIPYQAPYSDLKKIAFATDLSEGGIDVLQCVVGLAKYTSAEITITHIANEKTSYLEEKVFLKHFYSLAAAKVSYPHIFYTAINNKSVTGGLDWFTGHNDVDMLVMVHRKRNFFERLIDNSVSQKMADHSAVPLLVFPAAKVAELLPVF
jgi:nucleotide-binding universal stress UspA family protein